MSQNKFFKYVRNYFVRLPLSHYIPHFLPIMYGGIFIIAIFQLCISGVKNHYTLDVILIEAAIVLPISMILVPLILWVINAWWILFYCCPLKVSEQRDIHPQCCCNGIADDFSEGKPLS